jgi:hypothetical protein
MAREEVAVFLLGLAERGVPDHVALAAAAHRGVSPAARRCRSKKAIVRAHASSAADST